jgi:hypothetical protein
LGGKKAAGRGGRPRKYERLWRPRSEDEAQFVLDLCEVLRAVLGTGGRPPLDTPGSDAFEKFSRLHRTLAEVAARDRTLPDQLRRHLHWAVVRAQDHARMVKRLQRFVRQTARVLGQEGKRSAQVRADMDALLERIRRRLSTRKPEAAEDRALEHMLASAEHFGDQLYVCYDHPDIPPTSNEHEHTHGRLRMLERRVTAHKSTARVVRDGVFLAPLLERAQRQPLPGAAELATTPETQYRATLDRMRQARAHHAKPRNIRRRFDQVLARLAARSSVTPPPHSRSTQRCRLKLRR